MIRLADVHKRFGAHEVIKGISAEVAKGEVVCIIGPSGSGKSTILRCINGLESYDRGEIAVDGLRVDRNSRSITAVRTQVAMVFQRFNLFPHRTALENVMEGPIHVKKEPREELGCFPARLLLRPLSHLRQAEHHVLERGHVLEQVEALEHHADLRALLGHAAVTLGDQSTVAIAAVAE